MGRGHVSLGVDSGPLEKGLNAAQAKFSEWGTGVAQLGATIAAGGAGIAALGGVIAAPFLYGLSIIQDWGQETQQVMRQTGMSFAEVDLLLDGLRGNLLEEVAPQSVVAGLATMNKFLIGAQDGVAGATDAMSRMGLSVASLSAMTDSERLLAFADGLEHIGDTGRRSAIAMEIFGRRNVFAMNLQGGSAGIRARSDRVEELQGSSLHSKESHESARRVTLAHNEMKLATQGFWASLGLAAAPIMQDFYQMVTKVIIAVRTWTDENRPLLTTIFYIADKMILVGSIIAGVGTAIYALSYSFAFMSGIVTILGGVLSFFMSALSFLGGVVMVGVNAGLWLIGISLAVVKAGFGLLTIATTIWAVASLAWTALVWVGYTLFAIGYAVVTGIMIAAMWAYKTTMLAVTFVVGLFTGTAGSSKVMMWLYSASALAASAASLAFSAGTWVAVASTIAFWTQLVIAWIWENLVSAGLWLLVSVGVMLIITLGALVVAIAALTLGFGALFAGGLMMTYLGFESIGDIIPRIMGWFAALTGSGAGGIGDMGPWESLIGMFHEVARIATQTFGIVRTALALGSMDMAWEALATSAELAFIRIRGVALPLFYSIADSLMDAFSRLWTAVQVTAIAAWGAISRFVYPIVQRMLSGLANVLAAIPGREADSAAASLAAGNMVAQTEAQNAVTIAAAERDAVDRAARVEIERWVRDDAVVNDDAGRVARLEGDLAIQAVIAEGLRLAMIGLDWLAPPGGPGGPDRPGRPGDGITTSSSGTFSRFSAAGFLGAFTSGVAETAAEREARLARENLDAMLRIMARERAVVMR